LDSSSDVDDVGQGGPDLRVLLAAVEASGEAILITSAGLDEPGPRIEYINPAFTRMTGYEADEVIGRTPRLLQGPETDRAVLDGMRAALALVGGTGGVPAGVRGTHRLPGQDPHPDHGGPDAGGRVRRSAAN
jgi:PAS domain-containing protein